MALVAWYPLNGDTNDYSGNGFHLNNVGASVSTSGKIGSSYDFNGTSNYMYNADVSTYLHGKKEASIAMWIKKKSVQYGFIQLSGYANANGNLYPYNTETNAYLDIFRTNRLGAIEMPYSTLEWHHFVVTQTSGTNGWKLYQNGELVHQAFADDKVATNYLQFEIGRNSSSRYANALFNDIRIYDHALSEKEIKEISKAKVVHYDFDIDGDDSVVHDKSGFNNDGILSPVKPIWTTDSKIGTGAYNFDGTDKYISSTNNTFPDLTVSGWIKLNGTGSWMMVNKASGGTSGSYYIYGNSNTTCIWSIFGDTGVRYDVSMGSLDLGTWYHLVGTFNSKTGESKAYKNGVLVGTKTGATLGSNTSNILVGRYTSGYFTNGTIDDIRIYATALSEEDVKQIYNTRASIDDKGNMFVGEVDSKGFRTNVLDYSSWVVGSVGTQGGRFSLNGSVGENQIVVDENPWGQLDVMWQANNNDVDSGADGGWNTSSYPINKTKLYRYSVWIRRKVIGNGTGYFGCQGSTVYNISANTVNTNPYFWSGGISDTQWRLLIAYVLPYDTTHTSGLYEDAGIYKDGVKIATTNSFKWSPTATVGGHRSYLYYSTLPETNQQFYRPRMDIVDGTEPSLEDLLNGNEHRPLINKSGEYDFNKFSLAENGALSTGEIYEVGIPIRYIRDSMNGSSANTSNHWVEIEAYNPLGNNIALGKSATSPLLTDGNTASSPYYGLTSGVQTVEVDLGEVQIVSYLNIRHYYADGRTYYYIKTEVSADGINWETIFDSELDGRYAEAPEGKVILCKPRKFSISENGDVFLNELKEGMV